MENAEAAFYTGKDCTVFVDSFNSGLSSYFGSRGGTQSGSLSDVVNPAEVCTCCLPGTLQASNNSLLLFSRLLS